MSRSSSIGFMEKQACLLAMLAVALLILDMTSLTFAQVAWACIQNEARLDLNPSWADAAAFAVFDLVNFVLRKNFPVSDLIIKWIK